MRIGTFSNGGLGMGVMFTLYDNFTHSARRIQGSMNALGASANVMQARVKSSLGMLGIAGTGLLISFGILAAFIKGAKLDAQFERGRLSIEAFTGSAQIAQKVFKEIQADAIKNPGFGFQDMLKASTGLMAFNVEAEKSRQIVKNLANIILATGGGQAQLQRVAIQLQHVASLGFLQGQQVNAMARSGFPIIAMLKEFMGIKVPAKGIGSLHITIDQIAEAMRRAVEPTTKFAKALEKISEGSWAKWMQLSEAASLSLAKLGEAIRPFVIPLLDGLYKIVNAFREWTASPIGQTILKTVFALALLNAGIWILVGATAIIRLALFGWVSLLGAATKGAAMAAMAAGNMGLAWKIVGQAAWTAIKSFAPLAKSIALMWLMNKALNSSNEYIFAFGVGLMAFTGPFGVVIGLFTIGYRAINDFNKVMAGGTVHSGFMGQMEKLGGILKYLFQLFSSYDHKKGIFHISEDLWIALNKMGIGTWALKIAGDIARLIEFIMGVADAIIYVAKTIGHFLLIAIKSVGMAITILSSPFRALFGHVTNLDNALNKNTSTLESWKNAGYVVGAIISAVLLMLIRRTIMLGVESLITGLKMIIAYWELYVTLAMIATVIYAICKLFGYDLPDAVSLGMDKINMTTGSIIDKLGDKQASFKDAGKKLGTALSKGFLDAVTLSGVQSALIEGVKFSNKKQDIDKQAADMWLGRAAVGLLNKGGNYDKNDKLVQRFAPTIKGQLDSNKVEQINPTDVRAVDGAKNLQPIQIFVGNKLLETFIIDTVSKKTLFYPNSQ